MNDRSTHPQMRGRRVLTTGATGGIGYETARALAECGAQVVITTRGDDRGERAAAAIRGESGNERVSFLQADHSTVEGNEARALAGAGGHAEPTAEYPPRKRAEQ